MGDAAARYFGGVERKPGSWRATGWSLRKSLYEVMITSTIAQRIWVLVKKWERRADAGAAA